MVSINEILQADNPIIAVGISLIIAIYISTKSALDMIEEKKITTFMPFFILGLGLCLSAGFMFYDFYGIAVDVYLVFKFISGFGMFFLLWRSLR